MFKNVDSHFVEYILYLRIHLVCVSDLSFFFGSTSIYSKVRPIPGVPRSQTHLSLL